MTAVDVNVGDLLKVGEEEFDAAIKAMTVKNLMSVISGLQREMSREQEAFNSLSGELQKNKGRNSRQYKQISKDMVASQQQLTLLMNRSMKCFAQSEMEVPETWRSNEASDKVQNSPISNSSNGGGSDAAGGLRRRNSAKGHAPPKTLGVAAGADSPGPASRSAAISRSKSMHSVNHPGSPSGRQPPSLIASSSSSSSSNPASKTSGKPLIMHTSRPLNNATATIGGSTSTPAPTSSANANASGSLKPHMPIIMKPNGSASVNLTKASTASSPTSSSSSTAAASSTNATSAPTRPSTSSSLTPHTRMAGSQPTATASTNAGAPGSASHSHSSDAQGATNAQGSGVNPASEGSSSDNQQGQGGGSTGMYVKRRFGAAASRPTASTSTSSSLSSSGAVSSSQFTPSHTSSSSSSSASLPPRHPAQSRGRLQIVGSTRPTANNSSNTSLSPMLLSQPLSKSQGAIHHNHLNPSTEPTPASVTNGGGSGSATGAAAATEEFRGLPSVRQLAQSFGSMSALNTASSSSSFSSSGYTRNTRLGGGGGAASGRSSTSLLLSPGKGVARSSSSVGFLRGPPSSSSSALSFSPSASVSTHRLFLTNKGNAANSSNSSNTNGDSNSKSNGEVAQQQSQPSRDAPQQTNSVHTHVNGSAGVQQQQPAAQQQQQQRIRQLSTGRTPMSSSSFSIPASSSSDTTASDAENQLAQARARLKNRGSRGITADTTDHTDNTAVTSPATESSPLTPTSQTRTASSPPTEISAVQTTASPSATRSTAKLSLIPNNNVSKGVVPNGYVKQSSTSSSETSVSAAMPTASSPPLSSLPPSDTANSIRNNNDDTNVTVNTSSNNNLRRSRSRDELEERPARQYRQARQPSSGRETLLQQIQARRRYDDDDDDGVDGGSKDNFRAVSKLSMSMPSLLQTDPDQGDGSKERPIKSSVVLPPKTVTVVSAADGGAGDGAQGPGSAGGAAALGQVPVDDGDPVEQTSRMNLRDWDPSLVIEKLYGVKFMDEQVEDISHQFVSMEGLMEKLPMNKKKATLLKTWKRRFFRAKDGWLYYYETSNRDRPSETIQLMGGNIIDLGNRVLGIDDGRGRYLMVRCPTEKEHGQWVVALESQTADNTKATYVRPALAAARHPKKKVVVIDLGSSAIRAGVLGDQASLPELFIPSVVAVDPKSGKVLAVGQDALAPFMRQKCNLVYPIRPSNKVDQFNIEVPLMGAIFSKVFQELKVKPADYMVMLSTPQNLGDPLKQGLMQMLVDELNVAGVCMVQQALLSLYSYNATSGIIVDIGHRIEILPIFDGFIIEGGMARCPYGAQKVQESLTTSLLHMNYTFRSETEQLLVRAIMEESCYVAIDYAEEEEFCKDQPQTIRTSVNLAKFKLPEGSYETVEHDLSRFKSPEGFFNVDLWEMDYPTLQKLIHRAIQTCPMDNRRHMWRAVFLSGGVTMLPGFAERLERELTKLAPPGVPVEVHAAPQRYHAAFVGACSVALMPQFEASAISREEWRKEGCKAFRKWRAPS